MLVVAALDLVELARILELVVGEVAMRFHQPVASAAVLQALRDRHRLLDEPCQHTDRVAGSVGADVAYSIEGESAMKDGKTPEQLRFVGGQEPVAPIDRRSHRLLTLGHRPGARREQAKTVGEVGSRL